MASKRTRGSVPSARLRERLKQLEACRKSGESLKDYAQRHGLSVDSLYQAKKVARQQGLIAPYRRPSSGRSNSSPEASPSRFVKAVRRTDAPVSQSPAWRLRFAGGEVLESSTPLSADVARLFLDSLGRHS